MNPSPHEHLYRNLSTAERDFVRPFYADAAGNNNLAGQEIAKGHERSDFSQSFDAAYDIVDKASHGWVSKVLPVNPKDFTAMIDPGPNMTDAQAAAHFTSIAVGIATFAISKLKTGAEGAEVGAKGAMKMLEGVGEKLSPKLLEGLEHTHAAADKMIDAAVKGLPNAEQIAAKMHHVVELGIKAAEGKATPHELAELAREKGTETVREKTLDQIQKAADKKSEERLGPTISPGNGLPHFVAARDGENVEGKCVMVRRLLGSDGQTHEQAVFHTKDNQFVGVNVDGTHKSAGSAFEQQHRFRVGDTYSVSQNKVEDLTAKHELREKLNERDDHHRLPDLTKLDYAEPNKRYAPGTMVEVDSNTFALHQGQGRYVLFNVQSDLHGQAPPTDRQVTLDQNRNVEPVAQPHVAHAAR